MKDIRRMMVDGALVVLPIGAIALLIQGPIGKLEQAADPILGRFAHPVTVTVATLLMIGLLIRSTAGRRARRMLESLLFQLEQLGFPLSIFTRSGGIT